MAKLAGSAAAEVRPPGGLERMSPVVSQLTFAVLGHLLSGYSQGRGLSQTLNQCAILRPTCVVRSEERCHEQRHRSGACRLDSQQRDYVEAVVQDLLSDCNYRFDHWLGLSLRLGHRQIGKLADGLVQILCYPASDHDPESNVHFDRHRHRHRASPRSFR